MHWKLCIAVLLLAWICAPNEVQAARRNNYELLQVWDPQSLQILGSGHQSDYPSYRQVTSSHGGYNRRRQLKKKDSKSYETTERPIVSIWNNIVRSVRPSFTLRNLTNPFSNLFNNGNDNIVETVQLPSEQQNDDNEDEQDQYLAPAPSTNKRKRRRRPQQKRRPMYESLEQDDPNDYYGSALRQQQAMYYYGPNIDSYYNLRRLQAFNDYYNQYHYGAPEEEEQPQYLTTEEESQGKKYAVLRPLRLAIKVSESEDEDNEDIVSESETANENINAPEVVDESNSMQDDSASASASETLSESMRNAIGTYMRDDQWNRQRQRQSERQVESISSAKIKPRKHHRFLLAERLVNAFNKQTYK